jgi:hypothetical protein
MKTLVIDYDTSTLKREIEQKIKFCNVNVRADVRNLLEALNVEMQVLQALCNYNYKEENHKLYYDRLRMIRNKVVNNAYDKNLLLEYMVDTQVVLEYEFKGKEQRKLNEMLDYAFSVLATAKDYVECICAETEVNAVRRACNLPIIEQ